MTDEQFYQLQPIAVFGVSSRRKNFGAAVYKELVKAGIKTYMVNPKGGELEGQKICPSLADITESIKAAVILTKGQGALSAIEECARNNVHNAWLQGGSNTAEVRKRCDELGLTRTGGHCILLRSGRFPHSLHRFFHDLFNHTQKS